MLQMTEKEFRKILKDELKIAHKCRFDLTDEEAHQITQHIAGIKGLGTGDITSGFNEMQANHVYLKAQREFGETVAKKIKMSLILGLLGALAYGFWEGIKLFLADLN
jgi:hypothetical protein